ncbi:MAG: NADP-dependent isocitrate dehydrogenase [Alphaproteobacteria bacterium]|nr:NADP-dependent isocitrate dehydrogenase [Alphaproteobacteria bacterium]
MTDTPITVARGNGIGPEIMDATLEILQAAKARLVIDEIEIGEEVYKRGCMTGIEDSAWETLRKNKIFLKAPIFTPMGGGFKSLNVTVRKTLGLYANVRPCRAFHPFIQTHHPKMDVVIVRENEEDLYGGIEYKYTPNVTESLKLISRPGSERICRYAFEYAKANDRKKVTCMVKDNIMKISDGLFYETFLEIAAEYPDIESERYIVDIGAAHVAARPETFDVIVTENLYGDIISDIAAEVTGSVGLGISANIGDEFAMFEAMHGTAPDIAGMGIANPSGLLLGSVMMLVHIGQGDVAETVHNAWLKTIEDGIHTGDLYKEGTSTKRVGTADFKTAVLERIGDQPTKLSAVSYGEGKGALVMPPLKERVDAQRKLVGTDIFVYAKDKNVEVLASDVQPHLIDGLELSIISNRGVKVWPGKAPETLCSELWRLRLMGTVPINGTHVAQQITSLTEQGLDIVKTHNLYKFDEENGFSKAQGE